MQERWTKPANEFTGCLPVVVTEAYSRCRHHAANVIAGTVHTQRTKDTLSVLSRLPRARDGRMRFSHLVAAILVLQDRCSALRLSPCATSLCSKPRPRSTLRLDAPVTFEQGGSSPTAEETASRLAMRINTVLSRRTGRLIAILERLQDGHNYSAIFRTCETLGIQSVWIIGPPAERYASRQALKRAATESRNEKFVRADENRQPNDSQPQLGSKRMRRRERTERTWKIDADLDAEHAAYGRGAARFLTVRDFDNVDDMREELKAVPGVELWCSDLGQAACVLEPGAPWMETETIPARVGLVFGTESTGVSNEMLQTCDRRVYLPMHGFSDSLNVGVAAALALEKVKDLLGGGGDYLTDDWVPEPPDVLRERWARRLSRDDGQLDLIQAALGEGSAVFDDLRRPDEFRKHTGKFTRGTRAQIGAKE